MQQRDWRVIATAQKTEEVEMLKATEREVLKLNYSEPAYIAGCAEQTLKLTDGKLDALFNNGAYGQPGLIEDLPVNVLRDQFEANFFGWHDLTTRLIPAMQNP